ncbi:MAG TPA: ThiF family adenylyltransferase [Chloroflexota bacterium]|jgi:molybdopterin/thiamine biosynthesis adenylyltransferase|nr:ThiF family adenylyltransferase [Chloroflexota bacterium]
MPDMPVRRAIPRVKPIYPVYRVTDTSFRIGAQFGITAEFDDAEGQVWALVQLLDGTRDFPAIVAEMRDRFPGLTDDDIERGILALDQEGFLEDARPTAYDGSAPGLARLVGNVNYFRHFAGLDGDRAAPQDALRASKVVLLGLGGGGSSILPLLAAAGIGKIVAVDYDRVEPSNLNRQFLYRQADVGSLKTETAERMMAAMNSTIDFSTVTMKVESAEDVRPLIHDADLVVCAIDEPPFLAQRRVNYACVKEGVSCLYGFSQVTSGRLFSVVPGRSGCVDCLNIYYSLHDPLFVLQFEGFHKSDFRGPTIAFAPHIVRLAGMIAAEAVRLLTRYTEPQSIAQQIEFDFESGAVTALTAWPRYEECPTCGSGREADWPIFALYPGAVSREGEAVASDPRS